MAVGKGSYDLTRIFMTLGLMALVPLAWAKVLKVRLVQLRATGNSYE